MRFLLGSGEGWLVLVLVRGVGAGSLGGDGAGDFNAAEDAVGNSGAAVGCAGEIQAGMLRKGLLNFRDSGCVPEVVLWVCLGPAIGLGQKRGGGDSHDGAQFHPGEFDEGGVVLLGEILRESAADEDAQQNPIVRCAELELLRGPGAGGDSSTLALGDDEASATHGVLDIAAAV